MKFSAYIILTMAIILFCLSCTESPDEPHNIEYGIIFNAEPTEIVMKVGESITLNAIAEDTDIQGVSSLENKTLVWQILTGDGTISSNTGTEITFTAPSSIDFSEILTVVSVFPEVDMRHSKEIFITIKADDDMPVDTGICFSRDILPIFNSNCALSGCHNSISRKDGFDLTSYETIVAKDFRPGYPNRSEIYEVLVENDYDDRMPPPPAPKLPQEQIDLIYRWILEGGENKDCNGTPPGGCDTVNVTYAGIIKPVLELNCVGCHSPANLQGDIDLSTYSQLKVYIDNGSFIGSIRQESQYAPMPPNNLKLSDCNLRQIEIWLEEGAKNN